MDLLRRLPIVLFLSPGLAHAHGQFPLPISTLTHAPGSAPLMTATFGALIPVAGGGYTWICDELAGGNLSTPVTWVRTSQGTLVSAALDGVLRFSPDLCSAFQPQGNAATARVELLAAHPAEPVLLAAVRGGTVELSRDDGVTFAPVPMSQAASARGALLDGQGTDLRIVMHWGFFSDARAELEISLNGNRGTLVPLPAGSIHWRLLAHDPARPGLVYVRDASRERERLIRLDIATAEVGPSLLEAEDDLVLAVSADGQRVAMGGLTTGLRVSTDTGLSFTEVPTLNQVRGLTWSASGELYAAANNWTDGFAFGVSADNGRTWQGLGRFVDIRGVQSCQGLGPGCAFSDGGCTVHGNDVMAACGQYWPSLVELFGIGTEVPDAGVNAPDSGPGTGFRPDGSCACTGSEPVMLTFWLALLLVRRRWRR